MNALSSSLRALPNPMLPRDLTVDVLARVEAAGRPRPVPVSTPSRSPWAVALGSALAATAVAMSVATGDASLLRVTPPSIGSLGLPSSGLGAVTLLAGLTLYAAGLLAPIRRSAEGARRF